jgi:hypothetical protein
MKDGRVFALRMRGRVSHGRLCGNNNLIERDRGEISPVIKCPGSLRSGRARNRDLAGTARARARPPDRRTSLVQQIVHAIIRNQ